jgi:arylsulfatase A-like enzyme
MSESRPPNVLFLMADQMPWWALAGRSACRMPNVQRLVDRGLLFDRAYTPCAICCPARAMLISGAYHWHNGVYNQVHVSGALRRDMFPDVATYSQRLKDVGYHTAYVGKWHASHERSPRRFGFDHLAALMGCSERMLSGEAFAPGEAPADNPRWTHTRVVSERVFHWPATKPVAQWQTLEGDESGIQPAWVADAGIRALARAAASGRPWHVEVQWQAPHDPYVPFRQYVEHYDPAAVPIPPSFYDSFEHKTRMHAYEAGLWAPLSEEDFRRGRIHNYAFCEQLDRQIRRVLDALDRSGQADRTLVIFTTDHGDLVGAHRMYGKGWMPYEECYRIPLVAAWPGRIPAGARSNRLVQLHDLAHTLVEVCGARPLPFPDGRSLAPLFANPAATDWREAILCAYYGDLCIQSQRMIITDRHKYVFNGFETDEMYDLAEDPFEVRNLLRDSGRAGLRQDLRDRLFDLMTRLDDPLAHAGKYGIRRFLYNDPF